jgi:uncharacterized protein (DUF952 family)
LSERHLTYHLTPVAVWTAQAAGPCYLPEAFERDGFIHCTDGEAQVLEAGNRYYTGDERDYFLLTIDAGMLTSPMTYEDPARIFPHIYGPLNTEAVVGVRQVERSSDGRFTGFGSEI